MRLESPPLPDETFFMLHEMLTRTSSKSVRWVQLWEIMTQDGSMQENSYSLPLCRIQRGFLKSQAGLRTLGMEAVGNSLEYRYFISEFLSAEHCYHGSHTPQ